MNKINQLIVFSYLALFPFGQLPNLTVSLWLNHSITFQPTDILLGLLLILNIKNIVRIKLVYILAFSLVYSLAYYSVGELRLGFLYFIRLISYINLGIVIYELFKTEKRRYFLLNVMLVLVATIATFGWIQYFLAPDMRTLAILGWDDHYFRLAGTFLDPAFTGILLVLGMILSLFLYKTDKRKQYLLLCFVLLLTVGFTYSRSSYLAAIGGVGFYICKWIPKKIIVLGLALLILSLFQLPRPAGGEGVKLERLFSVDLKIRNSISGLSYLADSPLFGYGYNNSCLLQRTDNNSPIKSNSCSGFDNSIIFLLVTTGGVGLAIITTSYIRLLNVVAPRYRTLLISLSIALFIHGMFTNTFVYPWVLGFMAIVFGSTVKKEKVKEYK